MDFVDLEVALVKVHSILALLPNPEETALRLKYCPLFLFREILIEFILRVFFTEESDILFIWLSNFLDCMISLRKRLFFFNLFSIGFLYLF